MSDGLTNLDATDLAALVRCGEVTPLELVDASIARIEALNDTLGAVVTPLFEQARELARDPALGDGPFRGVPFLLKDLGCPRAGEALSLGNRALRDVKVPAPNDSYLAECFAAAGLIPIGRTNTPEFGLTLTTESTALGPARNAWNPEHSTGGSSGGSATAVAARIVPMAHANDGGGSIRIPASACGLVGLKSNRGRVSLGPDYGDQWHGLVVEGVVSRSVRDSAAALDLCAGRRPGDPYATGPPERPYIDEVGRDPGALRIGVMRQHPLADQTLHPDVLAALDHAAHLLERLGHQLSDDAPKALFEAESPIFFEVVASAHAARLVEEISFGLGRAADASDFEAYTWHLVERGRAVSGTAYIAAYEWLQVWARRIATWWDAPNDLLLVPTLSAPPPPLGWLADSGGSPLELLARVFALGPFTGCFNVTGQPAVSLPLYWNDAGLPIGVQLVAAAEREDLLVRVAAQLEQSEPWAQRRPPVCASD